MASEYVGSRISLISKSDIRYVGILHSINPVEATVSLEKVRSLGTEGRKSNPAEEMPQSENVYDFIVFRAADVKDLQIEAPAEVSAPLADPAIVATAAPTPSAPIPAQETASSTDSPSLQQQQPPNQQQYRQYPPPNQFNPYPPYPQQYGGPPQYPPYGYAPPPHFQQGPGGFNPNHPPYGYPPMQQQFNGPPPPSMESPALIAASLTSPPLVNQIQPPTEVLPSPVMAKVSPVLQATVPAPPLPVKARSYANPAPPASVTPIPAAAPISKVGKVEVEDVEQLVKDMSLQAKTNGSRPPPNRREGQSVFDSAPPRSSQQTQRTLQPFGISGIASTAPAIVVPAVDFDFQQSNAKFSRPGQEGEEETSSGVYNKKKSFFDDVSSDALDRIKQQEEGQRFDRAQERDRNMDTFGESGGDFRRGRGRGRGGRGRGRGMRGGNQGQYPPQTSNN